MAKENLTLEIKVTQLDTYKELIKVLADNFYDLPKEVQEKLSELINKSLDK